MNRHQSEFLKPLAALLDIIEGIISRNPGLFEDPDKINPETVLAQEDRLSVPLQETGNLCEEIYGINLVTAGLDGDSARIIRKSASWRDPGELWRMRGTERLSLQSLSIGSSH